MAITALPNPPSRSDPANFPERADAFMAALPTFAQEANLLQAQVNEAADAAGDSANAAASSAQDAATSRNQATAKAADAATSADAAASAKAGADTAANLAAQWASKTGSPVSGGEFSARHYAQLAAQGMGLPVFPPGNIPTADAGPIFVAAQGAMEWRGDRYVVQKADHGQCRFVYVNTTTLRLVPESGNGVVINGRQYRIQPSGVSITNASTAAGTAYYFYAKDDGSGGIALEARAAGSNPHSTHTDGVEILTGNPAYTLVGWASTTGTNTFQYTATDHRVMSWFNRRRRSVREVNSPSLTASASYVQLTAGVLTACWAGEEIDFDATGVVYSASGSAGMYLKLTVGGTADYGGYGYSAFAAGNQLATAVAGIFVAPSDGTYAVAPFGFVNANSGTFRQDLTAKAMI